MANQDTLTERSRKPDMTEIAPAAGHRLPMLRSVLTYMLGGITLLTCPCHLPILLLLLSGTAAGAYLSENLGAAALIMLPVFVLSGLATWRLLDRKAKDEPQHRGF